MDGVEEISIVVVVGLRYLMMTENFSLSLSLSLYIEKVFLGGDVKFLKCRRTAIRICGIVDGCGE